MTENEQPKVEEKVEITQENNSISPENEINWKKHREQRAAERKAREEAEVRARKSAEEAAALKAAMEALVNKKNNYINDISDDTDREETEDERIQKKIDNALAQERKKQEHLQREREIQETPYRLKQMYNDFDEVCSQENIDRFEFDHPEIAAAFEAMPDGINKWSNVYKAIKKFIPNPKSNIDQKKAEKNFVKPQSMSVGGSTQTGDQAPQMLDSKKRADNWNRMQRVMKGVK